MPAVDEYSRSHRAPADGASSSSNNNNNAASSRSNLSATFQHQVQMRAGASGPSSLRASYQDKKKRHSNSSRKSAQMRHSLTHVQADAPTSGRSSASSTSGSALSPPPRSSNFLSLHTTSRDLSPQQQLHPEYPAAPPAGDDILKVEIPRWKSKLTTDRADRVHIPAGADSAGNSPVASGAAGRSSTWNGKDGRRGHGGSMGALVLGRDREGGSKKRYTVFQVYVHFQSGAVRVSEKRYSHFRELHKTLRRKYATVGKLYFPPKKFFMSLSLRVIEQRREAIETYMNAVLTLRPRPVEVVQFLSSGSSSVDEDEDGNSTDGPARGVDMVTAPKHVQSTSTALGTSSRLSGSNSFASEDAGGHMVTMQDFEILKMLGKGSFGKVYMARERGTDGKIYAMKVLRKSELVKRNQDKRLAMSPKNEFQGFSYTRIEEPASLSRESSSKREKRRSGRKSEPRVSEGIEHESQWAEEQQYLEFGLVGRDSTDFDTGCI
ncbi:hypothetical protein PF002_g20562 [Phytophthora fragariae]|uniref:non-specific serine/threonine protein kinase n=1 Tax=Phytophthora fragariae TaxID=53985 RepID=A0A6A3XSG9_9STRA|nr:hypothetical protein PF002_g20562 [Phytophthora fragariae]